MPPQSSRRRHWAACCVTGACTTSVCLALALTRKSSARTDLGPKRYADRSALLQSKISFFTSAGSQKRRTPRLCFVRSEVCSDAVRLNFIYSGSATGRNERNSGNCNCKLPMFHGFATALILVSSQAFIAPPISSFTLAFRKHLVLPRSYARRAERQWYEFVAATWIILFVTIRNPG